MPVATRAQQEAAFANFVRNVMNFGDDSDEEKALRALEVKTLENLADISDNTIDKLTYDDNGTKKDVAEMSKTVIFLGKCFLAHMKEHINDNAIISTLTKHDFSVYRKKRRMGQLEANYTPTNATGATIGSTVTISHKVPVEPLITATGTTNGSTTTIARENSVGPSDTATGTVSGLTTTISQYKTAEASTIMAETTMGSTTSISGYKSVEEPSSEIERDPTVISILKDEQTFMTLTGPDGTTTMMGDYDRYKSLPKEEAATLDTLEDESNSTSKRRITKNHELYEFDHDPGEEPPKNDMGNHLEDFLMDASVSTRPYGNRQGCTDDFVPKGISYEMPLLDCQNSKLVDLGTQDLLI